MDDKDIGVVTTVPDYHAGLREKADEADPTKAQPSTSTSKNAFERYITQIAIINFGFCLQASWEGVALTFQFAWLNGGPAALVYGCLVASIGSTAVATALGEMASMDPTVGAQYRWSARFAQHAPEFWGFMQGWITVSAWTCSCAGSLSVLSNCVSGLIIFHHPTYEPQRWHATLLLIAFVVGPVLLNLALRKMLNSLETIGGIFHVIFFIVIVATLATLSKRSTPEFVFNTLNVQSGWNNPGVAWSIGLLTAVFPISSFDGVLHMIDETKEPRKRVPRSMVISTICNGVMQFAFSICLLFCIGDADAVSNSSLPLVEVFYSATGSKAASTVLVLLVASIVLVSNFNIVASVSRLAWAFARDKGLPFGQYFSYIHPTLQIPLPALVLVGTIVCLLSLINLGSTVAFNALIALPTIALYISYIIPITLLTLRQLAGRHPVYGPWQLGRWSIPIKLFSLCYLIYVTIFIAFPTIRPVTSLNMNYAGPVFLGVILIALADWFTTGHKRFEVPTAAIEAEVEHS